MSLFEGQKKLQFSNVLSLVSSRKLDTALRASTAPTFLSNRRRNTLSYDELFFDQALKYQGINLDEASVTTNVHAWCYLLFDTLSKPKVSHTAVNTISRLQELLKTNLSVQMSYMSDSIDVHIRDRMITPAMKWISEKTSHFPPEIIALAALVLSVGKMVEASAATADLRLRTSAERLEKLPPQSHYEDEDVGIEIIWSETLLYIAYRHIRTIVPRHYLLLLHNKAADILSVLLYFWGNDGASLEEGSYALVLQFLISLAEIHQSKQNKAMEISKSLEALGVGLTLIEADGVTNKSFLDEILASVCNSTGVWVVKETFYRIMAAASVPLRHELMCLSKVLGHPFVDMEAGSKKLHKKTTAQIEIDLELTNLCIRHAKRSYIKNYILKHGKWPPVAFLGNCPALIKAWSKNRDPDSSVFVSSGLVANINDYDFVELQKDMNFNMLDNVIPYLKDKTISVLRSKVVQKYINQESVRMNWEETRLMLLYLLHDIDPKVHQDYIQMWCNPDPLDFQLLSDYLVIRVVPKEKELKVEYRGFGCKPYEDRMRTICQELNVADYMDSYNNEQALTLSELDILKRLSSFRRIAKAYKGFTPVYIVIDASAWNNKFRHETVFPVMSETLDKIFGVNIFSRTMLAYEHTLIYVPDHDGTFWWNGQLGGIEGLNQYTWDAVYLPQIRACLQETGYDPRLFARGDDLRAVILVPPELLQIKTIESIRLEVVTKLTENMKKLGHDININESYGSLHYFAFSKVASLGVMELPEGARKIQKAYGANNAFLPLLDDFIGSAYSVCHSACKTSSNPLTCYLVALFWTGWHLLNHQKYGNLSNLKLVALTLTPGLMGGFPIIYLHNLWVRAESDLLSPYIGLLHHVHRHFPNLYLSMKGFLHVTPIPRLQAFQGLLADPYSLPIKKPIAAATVLRKLILPALRAKIKNTTVLELIAHAESHDTAALVACLASCNVYLVKILSAIYAASPAGLLEELLRKFESSRSVCEILILRWGRKGAAARLLRVMRADAAIHEYRYRKLQGIAEPTDQDLSGMVCDCECPAKGAYEMRASLWGKPIEGITMPPMQHQVLLISPRERSLTDWELKNAFQLICHPSDYPLGARENTKTLTLPIYSVGTLRPFCGFATRAGKTAPQLKLVESNEILDKVKTLIDLMDWVDLYDERDGTIFTSNLPKLIRKIIALYVPLDVDSLIPFQSGKKAGTIEHHIRCRQFREAIMPNMLGNIYTRAERVTNCHLTLRQSSYHYRVNYLHIYCYATSMAFLPEMVCNTATTLEKIHIATTPCSYCTTPIIEPPVVCDSTYLGAYNPRPLHTLALSGEAVNILKRSLEIQKAPVQRRGEPISTVSRKHIEEALLQYYTNSISICKQRICDFVYHHPCDQESMEVMGDTLGTSPHVQIGYGEFKRIKTESYLSHIMVLVIKHVYMTWPDCTLASIAAYIASMPSETFPWYPVVEVVFEIGRLTDLVRLAHNRSGILPPACQESKSAARAYLGLAAYTIYTASKSLDICWTTFSLTEIDELDNDTQALGLIIKHRWAKQHLYPDIKHLTNMREAAVRSFYDTLVLFWASPIETGLVREALTNAPLNKVFTVALVEIQGVTQEDLVMAYDLQTIPRIAEGVLSLDIFKPFGGPQQVLEELVEDFERFCNAKDYLVGKDTGLSMHVLYSTLSDCINAIRTYKVIAPGRDELTFVIGDKEAVVPRIRMRTPKPLRFLRRLYGYQGTAATLTPYNMNVNLNPLGSEVPYVRTWYYYRPLGFGTSAPSKLVRILSVLGMDVLPNQSCYWSLGDGFGGFAATINNIT